MAFQAATRAQVEAIVGTCSMFTDTANSVDIRPDSTVTFKQLAALSELFGTDRIDFNFGDESRYDSQSAYPGEITVYKDHAVIPGAA